MKITIGKAWVGNKTILFCPDCERWTIHALSTSGEFFACGCGETIEVEYLEENEDGNEN